VLFLLQFTDCDDYLFCSVHTCFLLLILLFYSYKIREKIRWTWLLNAKFLVVYVDSFKYHSEENVSMAVSESSPPVSIGAHPSPQFAPLAPQYHPQYLSPHAAAADEHRALRHDDNMTSIIKQLEQGREMQIELQDAIADIQVFTLPVSVVHFGLMPN